jgi:PadR family transcriptional regulator, regulatory protein PadR
MAGLGLLQGTLDLVVMQALAGEPRHGYQIARWVRHVTDGALHVDDGALYTALHRLEKRGWLESEWGATEQNRRAKFYAMTEAGRRELASEARTWREYAAAMMKVLQADVAERGAAWG